MAVVEPITTATDAGAIEVDPLCLAYACERCGQQRARYVVADLEETDTSLYCPGCIVLTFAEVAARMGAEADA